jgi:hypothetical protein
VAAIKFVADGCRAQAVPYLTGEQFMKLTQYLERLADHIERLSTLKPRETEADKS